MTFTFSGGVYTTGADLAKKSEKHFIFACFMLSTEESSVYLSPSTFDTDESVQCFMAQP